MKRFRVPAIIAAALVGVLLLAGMVAFTSSFQTWVARKSLANQPGWRADIGRVSAGLKHVELKDLRFERGGAVLTVPALEADVSLLSAGFQERVEVIRVVAKGWTLDLSKIAVPLPARGVPPDAAPTPVPVPPQGGGTATPPTEVAGAVSEAFSGIFGQLTLPVDLSLDNVDLEGDVILPDSGRMRVTIRGGGLRAGQEGKFALTTQAALADPTVHTVQADTTLTARMDTPRSFTRVAARVDAEARGSQFPNGVKLASDLAVERAATGETYTATIVTQEREIFRLQAQLPQGAPQFDGTWKVDVRTADLTPFVLGQPLPEFATAGEGKFDADARFTAIHAVGRLGGTTHRLAVLLPQLAELGALSYDIEFDIAQRGPRLTVDKLAASIAAEQPVARVQALQAFEFNPRTAEFKAADPASDLLAVSLLALPLTWARPVLGDFALTGGQLTGEFVATPGAGGVRLRSTSPVSITPLSLAQGGKPLLRDVSFTLNLSADYAPRGWQAEVTGLTAKGSAGTILTLDARAGQLTGDKQPIKATGKLSADLPALLAQPALSGKVALTQGAAAVDFVASLDGRQELQARLALSQLAVDPKLGLENLPAVAAEVRADVAEDGKLTLSAPIVLERGGRKSDVAVAGTFAATKGAYAIEARVTSEQFVLEDAKVLSGLVPATAPQPDGAPAPGNAPPWAGLTGSVVLQLKKVIYSELFEATHVGGTLRIEGGNLKLETVRAGLGPTGEAKLAGTVIFDANLPQPYALAADLAVTEFDIAPIFLAKAPDQPPTVEGKFNITSKLTSRAATLGDLALGAGGDFQLTSRGGLFRGLPANVVNLSDTTGRLAGLINAIGSRSGKSEYEDIANKAQAVAEFTKAIGAVPFDQLSVVILRDTGLNAVLKDFTLISPELRLTGTGQTRHRAGTALMDDALEMEFKLRARGRQADLLRYLGVLEPKADDFGYAACTLPLNVGGTVRRPATAELNQRLASLALEKSGLGDKASELFNRIRGNGTGAAAPK